MPRPELPPNFAETRKSGFGGSDAQNYCNLPPYGCARKAAYEKTGTPADFPFVGNKDTDRGIWLEPIVAEMYAEKTGRELLEHPEPFRHSELTHMFCHVDRLIINAPGRSSTGVLSIKCPGVSMFAKCKREGLPDSWIAQLQHELFVTGCTWGGYAVFSAERWDMIEFDFDADAEYGLDLARKATAQWMIIQAGQLPDRLDPSDDRCKTCTHRTTCQGAALIESLARDHVERSDLDTSLDELAMNVLEADGIADEAESVKEAARNKLKEAMGNRPEAYCSVGKINYRPYESNRLDTTAIRRDHPDIANQYMRASVVRPLRVVAAKG